MMCVVVHLLSSYSSSSFQVRPQSLEFYFWKMNTHTRIRKKKKGKKGRRRWCYIHVWGMMMREKRCYNKNIYKNTFDIGGSFCAFVGSKRFPVRGASQTQKEEERAREKKRDGRYTPRSKEEEVALLFHRLPIGCRSAALLRLLSVPYRIQSKTMNGV